MTKEKFAQNYANEKLVDLTSAIMEAYLEGYKQGELKAASTIDIDGVTYYDLGLPSGTLWSEPIHSHLFTRGWPYTLLPYSEANKLNIPTEDQLKELIEYCKFNRTPSNFYPKSIDAIGASGQRITISYEDYNSNGSIRKRVGEQVHEGYNYFWLKDSLNGTYAIAGAINSNEWAGTKDHFAGYKLPVILVKSKDEI